MFEVLPGRFKKEKDVNWIILGRETGPREERFAPKREWIIKLRKSAQLQGIPVWMKNNLAPGVFAKSELIQELPERKK
jgi:hypothetical protein